MPFACVSPSLPIGSMSNTDVCSAASSLLQGFSFECRTHERYRYWQSWRLGRIDLRDPAAPRVLTSIDTGPAHEMKAVASGCRATATASSDAEESTSATEPMRRLC